MAHVYTPTGTGSYVGAYTMPDDGDPRNASAFNVPMEGMSEDIKRVKGLLDAGAVDYAASRTFEFTLTDATNYWSRAIDPLISANQRYWSQQLHATVSRLEAPLDLPDGFIIDSIDVWLNPLTGRPALTGTVLPSVELIYSQLNVGPSLSGVSLGSQVDTSASVAAYEQLHKITLTLGTPHTVLRSTRTYAISFSSETGTNPNAQPYSRVYMAVVNGTVKKVY